MTVQELYDIARKNGDPSQIELKLRPDGDDLAEVEFEREDDEVRAYLIPEGCIHL